MNEFPWYKSGILQAQVVAFILAALSFFNVALDFDVTETVAAVFAGVGALVAIYTFLKRLFAPSPNLTKTADKKEAELVKDGTIPLSAATHSVAIAAGNAANKVGSKS